MTREETRKWQAILGKALPVGIHSLTYVYQTARQRGCPAGEQTIRGWINAGRIEAVYMLHSGEHVQRFTKKMARAFATEGVPIDGDGPFARLTFRREVDARGMGIGDDGFRLVIDSE